MQTKLWKKGHTASVLIHSLSSWLPETITNEAKSPFSLTEFPGLIVCLSKQMERIAPWDWPAVALSSSAAYPPSSLSSLSSLALHLTTSLLTTSELFSFTPNLTSLIILILPSTRRSASQPLTDVIYLSLVFSGRTINISMTHSFSRRRYALHTNRIKSRQPSWLEAGLPPRSQGEYTACCNDKKPKLILSISSGSRVSVCQRSTSSNNVTKEQGTDPSKNEVH